MTNNAALQKESKDASHKQRGSHDKNNLKKTLNEGNSNMTTDAINDMQLRLKSQKAAQIAGGHVSAELRIDRLKRSIAILEQNGDALCDACLLYTSDAAGDPLPVQLTGPRIIKTTPGKPSTQFASALVTHP